MTTPQAHPARRSHNPSLDAHKRAAMSKTHHTPPIRTRLVDPESLLPSPIRVSTWTMGLSFSTALTKAVRMFEGEREAARARQRDHHDPIQSHGHEIPHDQRQQAESSIDEKSPFWLREEEDLSETQQDDDDDSSADADDNKPTPPELAHVEFNLGDLLQSARETRREVSYHDFEVLRSSPAVIALEDIKEHELEPHDPWEHVEWGEPAKELDLPTYAEVVTGRSERSEAGLD